MSQQPAGGEVLAPSLKDAVERCRLESRAQPTRAAALALQLDLEAARLGEDRPITVSAHGWTVAQDGRIAVGLDEHDGGTGHHEALWRASLSSSDGPNNGVDASAYGFLNVRGSEIPALNLLYANQALGLDRLWLRYVNKYLAYFPGRTGAPCVALRPGTTDRISRLTAASRAPCGVPVTEQPLVSILMPARNAEATLEMAAHSILSQTWERLELIVLDDASTDGTSDLARRLMERDPRVRAVRLAENVGPYVAKNIGAYRHARGDYLTVHDADDWALPTRLEEQMQPALEGRLRGNACRVTLGNSLRMERGGRFTRFQRVGWVTRDGAMRTCFPSPLIDRQYFFDRLGGWDEVKVGADTELLQRIRRFDRSVIAELNYPVMLQLDDATTLTRQADTYNDDRGEAPVRIAYRQAWSRWHAAHAAMPRIEPNLGSASPRLKALAR